ncbi:ABC transporter permease [Actinomyces minihominis]|uniref:ABC transporter permease n=1 Tax=Actinomyces minihominis TaxID=2002838 RepID=UPI000C069F8D|nr:ABC transporter permease [Actinomyces minihominis]
MSSPAVLDPEPPTLEPDTGPDPVKQWWKRFVKGVLSPGAGTIALAILLALLIGALIVVIFDPAVQHAAGYLFAAPGDFFSAVWEAFSGFFTALVRGSIFDWRQSSFQAAIRPLTESIVRATPLIIAGLAVAVSFTAGLFNIGVQGQLIMGALLGGYIGFAWNLPVGIHLLVAILGAILGGAIWGFIPGILKARLGANEVIVTIMLNSVAALFLAAMLQTTTFYGEGYPGKSMKIFDTALYPGLLGGGFRLNASLIAAILASIFVWWLMDRSTFGFEIRAAGANPDAAKTAGINVPLVIMLTLTISGALAGLAATAPVLGTERAITGGVAGSIGFDAITVALLGRSRPVGVFFAGLLFGALAAGGALMQSSAGIPVDIVIITQAIIVLTIAASEAIRASRAIKRENALTVKKVDTEHEEKSAQTEGVQA